ncbi:hypothetical protein ACQ4PT_016925 [Festuca glaucescens]
MPRRERRLGVAYITNDKERDVTFFKRRFGLFKSATDLSIVTGARVAVILETDRGKMHSFGTPSAKPIVDAFLSGAPPTTPFVNEAKASNIALLQSKVAQLDMKNAMEDKRNKLSIQRMKEIQDENPGMAANLIFSKEEDLCLEDLNKLFNELSKVQEDIRSRLPPLHHGLGTKNGGPSMKRNMLPPRGQSLDHMHTTLPSVQFSWSHHLSQHQLPSVPLTSPRTQTLAPVLPMEVPQVLHSKPPALEPQYASILQPIPDILHELFAPQDLHLHNYPSPCNTVQQPENYVGPKSTSQHNLEAFPQLANSGVNDLVFDNTFGYDPWGYPMIDRAYNNGFRGMDPSLGYNGANVDQSSIGNGGWGYAPPESSSSRQDVDIHAVYGGFV